MARIRVYRSKYTSRPRHSGRHNWIVLDEADGQTLVFLSFDLALAAADQLARTGHINPTGLVGCGGVTPKRNRLDAIDAAVDAVRDRLRYLDQEIDNIKGGATRA